MSIFYVRDVTIFCEPSGKYKVFLNSVLFSLGLNVLFSYIFSSILFSVFINNILALRPH